MGKIGELRTLILIAFKCAYPTTDLGAPMSTQIPGGVSSLRRTKGRYASSRAAQQLYSAVTRILGDEFHLQNSIQDATDAHLSRQ